MRQSWAVFSVTKNCSTAGCWTWRAEMLWPATLGSLSQESRSVSQPTGMQHAWDQARKEISQVRSVQDQHSPYTATGTAAKYSSQGPGARGWTKPEPLSKRGARGKAPPSLFSHSSSQQHGHTASELALSTRLWTLRSLRGCAASHVYTNLNSSSLLGSLSLRESTHQGTQLFRLVTESENFTALCIRVVMNLTHLQEYEQPCTIFFRVRILFYPSVLIKLHMVF